MLICVKPGLLRVPNHLQVRIWHVQDCILPHPSRHRLATPDELHLQGLTKRPSTPPNHASKTDGTSTGMMICMWARRCRPSHGRLPVLFSFFPFLRISLQPSGFRRMFSSHDTPILYFIWNANKISACLISEHCQDFPALPLLQRCRRLRLCCCTETTHCSSRGSRSLQSCQGHHWPMSSPTLALTRSPHACTNTHTNHIR